MKSMWKDEEAAQFEGELGQRVYTSRLLGQDPSLVLHGGGNTSLKVTVRNFMGEDEEIVYVKGSGWDLATIEAQGFSPVRRKVLLRMAEFEQLDDETIVREQRASMLDASAPNPTVEAILHGILPYRYVDHTHADAVIAIANTPGGEDRLREIYGDSVVYIPYVKPGFPLARTCALTFPAQVTDQTIGMLLYKHGIFSFGDTAKESYERMIDLVSRAEDYLARHNAWQIAFPQVAPTERPLRVELAELRRDLSSIVGAPVLVMSHQDPQALSFAQREDIADLATRGPATPDHSIRTKHIPLVGRDLDGFVEMYKQYYEDNKGRSSENPEMLDPAPRVILDPEYGMLTVGRTLKDARIAEDVYRHTIDIILRAEALGGWDPLAPSHIFDVEYWGLEQAKLRTDKVAPVFTGEVALVTGAATGIGKACVASLLARGATVVALDIKPEIETTFDQPEYVGMQCDVTSEEQLTSAIETVVRRFGGLDMLVLNAGVFPPSTRISALTLEGWDRVMRINLTSNVLLLREAHPLLKLAPNGGRVAIVGSKNVAAPGPGASMYSASKAALTQLMRVAALEWGEDHIRINTVHPDAVFDTALWTEEILQKRAQSYGMTVEQYKTKNILKTEITSHHVGEMVAEMCGPLFSRTTGAQIPLDGGNDRVI
jgi:rhamnose utilization protein RhaD (predicted bifunctional aldolase and dehydrogenase)/NAD(P)-dependent dehydrogenase (short-subunit alcohol dehydrogenase family)